MNLLAIVATASKKLLDVEIDELCKMWQWEQMLH